MSVYVEIWGYSLLIELINQIDLSIDKYLIRMINGLSLVAYLIRSNIHGTRYY